MVRIFSIPVFLAFIAVSAISLAQPKYFDDLPQKRAEQGNAFIEAWLAFRRDLDSMAHSGGHPVLLDKWFEAMPPFLARDAARLATEPKVILAAATRLSALGGETNRRIIAKAEKLYRGRDLGGYLGALAILSGDRAAKRRALESLKSDWLQTRLSAAVVLTQAKEEKGRAFLRRLLQKGKDTADIAARALGRYGKRSEDTLLSRAYRRDPENPVLSSARGELAIRYMFPYHYQMLLGRNPGATLLGSRGELYDTWLTAIGNAIHEQGARTSTDVAHALEKLRHHPDGKSDKEVKRRRIKALIDFWARVDEQIAMTPARPSWPADFTSAMQTIRRNSNLKDDNPGAFTSRIAAEIAVCSIVGKKIDYDHVAIPNADLKILTPGGKRAVDGNLATAWHAAKGDALTFETDGGGQVEALWIMSACRPGSGAEITSLEITGYDAQETWTQVVQFSKKIRYYQKVPINGRFAHRLTIQIRKTKGSGPACISEVRLKFNHPKT